MPRKPVSEYEWRDHLQEEGWNVLMAPASLGAADMIAYKPVGLFFKLHELFEMRGYQVKETRKNTVYLSQVEVDEMLKFQKETGMPMTLVVKFKGKGRGKAGPRWVKTIPKKKVSKP